MRTLNEVLLNAGDASGDLESSVLDLEQIMGFAITAVITGTAAGTIKLQGSTDPGKPGPAQGTLGIDVVNWTDIAGSSQAVSGAGTVTWNFSGAFYKWAKVVYTSTSGTGSITCIANAKGF